MKMKSGMISKRILLSGFLVGTMLVATLNAQSPAPAAQPPVVMTPYRFPPNHFSSRELRYYGFVWGIGSLSVKLVESGEIIRFSWHVLDADKAKPLSDKKVDPSLVDPQAGVKLVVPSLEQVGQLRQSSTPEAGKSYWMAFSNSGRLVKRGDHVNVVIGQFHADGLIVE
jgi:hypothetical protein